MKKIFFITILLALGLSSCNEWLDVRPMTESKEQDQFSTYKGFKDALIGCYMTMADRSIYGENLSMTYIESLANLWYMVDNTTRYTDRDLSEHNYESDYSKAAIESIYASLFNTIFQANLVIKHIDEDGDVILDKKIRDMIQGEAYAIRAYCQFDVLRLFGQIPSNATVQVELPYSEATTFEEIPPYYNFNDYVKKLEDDLAKAENLLKDNDPLFTSTFASLNDGNNVEDDFIAYRQFRLNYYAVKALQARMYLYIGQPQKAYSLAKEVMEAKNVAGNPLREMSGSSDISKGYYACPSECLFSLSKYDVKTYSSTTLIGGYVRSFREYHLCVSLSMKEELYRGENQSSHNRFYNLWNDEVTGLSSGNMMVAIKKYWYNDDVEGSILNHQIIPMLRMSEMCLIQMETTIDLAEANSLYTAYMLAHDVLITDNHFANLDEVKEWVMNEYRREFFAEGQMFYTYKRNNTTNMLWGDRPLTENDYILPLPETEYNPNL